MKTLAVLLAAVVVSATAAERFVCEGEDASFSPDGKSIVFQRFEGGRFGVFVRNMATGEEKRLSAEGVDAIQPEWSADGRIVWTEANETKTALAAKDDTSGWNLVESAGLAKRTRQLTQGRHRIFSPTFGPKGEVYFVSEIVKPENGSIDVYSGNRTGIGALTGEHENWYRKVTVLKDSNTGIADPHFAAGLMVRAEVAGYNFPWRIVVSPADRPEERTYLTGNDMVGVSPTISSDGRRVAFSGCRKGDDGWQVYLMAIEDGHTLKGSAKRIAKGGNPAFAPNDKAILFDRDGRIYEIEVER